MTSSAWDNFVCILNTGSGNSTDYNQYAYDIFDGSDSPHFPAGDSVHCQYSGGGGNACGSGQGIYGRAYDVHNCVFRYLSNFMVTSTTHTVHDNLFEYLLFTFSSGDQQHPNVLNNLGGPTGDPIYFYNNVMRHTYVTEDIYLAVRTTAYIFNNVFYDNMNSPFGVLANGCIRLNSVGNSAASQSAYFYNNTEGDSSCGLVLSTANSPLTTWNGTVTFQNNHFIGSSALSAVYIINSGVAAKIVDNGDEIFQTASAAAAQGYTAANNFAPTLQGGSTVGAGANLSGSCGTFSTDSALCSSTSGAVIEQAQGGTEVAALANRPVARPSSGAWDAGAYYFSGGSTSQPAPPNGLSANVQ